MDTTFEAEIIQKTKQILQTCEQEGRDAAMKLWKNLDQLLDGKREGLSSEVFDLVIQLEFFMDDHPESDITDLTRAVYVAEVAVEKGC